MFIWIFVACKLTLLPHILFVLPLALPPPSPSITLPYPFLTFPNPHLPLPHFTFPCPTSPSLTPTLTFPNPHLTLTLICPYPFTFHCLTPPSLSIPHLPLPPFHLPWPPSPSPTPFLHPCLPITNWDVVLISFVFSLSCRGGEFVLGCTTHYIPPVQIKKLLDSGGLHVSPNGVVFVRKHVRHGILPRLVDIACSWWRWGGGIKAP